MDWSSGALQMVVQIIFAWMYQVYVIAAEPIPLPCAVYVLAGPGCGHRGGGGCGRQG